MDSSTDAASAGTRVTGAMHVQRPSMNLHMVRGSLCRTDDGSAAAMDAEVWSQLPKDLIWEVLKFAPPASRSRWQSVSREWHQTLTSADFRSKVVRVAMVACVCKIVVHGSKLIDKLVHVDLASFVPAEFWKPGSSSYRVVAAGHGLVCISNHRNPLSLSTQDLTGNKYCVLNPVTRTCRVVPQVPFKPTGWLLPSSTAFTIYAYEPACRSKRAAEVAVATLDLAGGGAGSGGGRWNLAAHQPESRWGAVRVAVCGGETFMLYNGRVHVLAAAAGGGGGPLVEVAALNEPSSVPPAAAHRDAAHQYRECLITAHRGAVFLLTRANVTLGVWRLARQRLEWEAVAWLDVADLERLTSLTNIQNMDVRGACSAGECLWFNVEVRCFGFELGFNLDTGAWERVHDDKQRQCRMHIIDHELQSMDWDHVTMPFELRPDLFL